MNAAVEANPSTPRLSIIIATWQAARTLERCLDSIVNQDFRHWELLIADGASTDATVEILRRREADITWWNSEPDNGIYDAWNKALQRARGDYVCFLGADDAWASSSTLSTVFERIGSNVFDLVTSTGHFHDSETGKTLRFGSAFDYRRLGRRMIVCHPGMLHRRGLFDEHGLFDDAYKIAGDLEFLLRLPASVRALHLDEVTVIVEAAGVSRRNVMARLREQRQALTRCERYGPVRAYIAWLDKLWRLPIARLLNLSH